ncbi:hypothetical protein GQ44DRAFT_711893 [Phaeosphaeriaceae sp. PMI808]|nr:hypothetical protein GQ44DRAFT_711893 [Phaeosphaeriaceae sp. PMI808]
MTTLDPLWGASIESVHNEYLRNSSYPLTPDRLPPSQLWSLSPDQTTVVDTMSTEAPINAVASLVGTSYRMIGTVLVDSCGPKRRYGCVFQQCVGKTFGRTQELVRHVKDIHSDSLLYCPHLGCERSFSKAREDRLKEHVERVHKALP